MHVSFILAALTLSVTIFFSACDLTFAQNNATSSSEATTLSDPGAVEIGESLIAPDSPLYFLKTIRERIEVLLSPTTESKVNRELEFAQRRLREVRALVKNKKQDLIPVTLEKYKLHLSQIDQLSKENQGLQARAGEAVARHLDVLQRVYDAVGNPAAKQAILASLERAEEHNRKLIDRLDVALQQKLIKNIAARQHLACQFLIRESTSSGLNDTERAVLQERIAKCKELERGPLKDQLEDLRR